MSSERYTNIDEPFLFLGSGFSLEGSPVLVQPKEILTTNRRIEVRKLLLEIQNRVLEGFYAAGWISYEAGELFLNESNFHGSDSSKTPYLWFGIFDKYKVLSENDVSELEKEFENEGYSTRMRPSIQKKEYQSALDRIQEYLRNGDAYQVNFTFPLEIDHDGSLGKLFFQTRKKQPVPYEAWIHTGRSDTMNGVDILSFSPELFWERTGDQIRTLPMKGTRPRGKDANEDQKMKEDLRSSAKDRAENLMITDLLRNDLGRISVPGSVQVSKLFSVEGYPTVFQMTSEIRSQLLPKTNLVSALEALFPGGSITGAPKKRASEIIGELENERGVYTGGIFFLSPEKDTVSVAIRTMELHETESGRRSGRIGVGSGITVESEAESEWEECWSKVKFLKDQIENDPDTFHIFTTMLYKRGCVYFLKEHKERMKNSASDLGFIWSDEAWEKEIENLNRLPQGANSFRVRIRLLKNGSFVTETSPLRTLPKRGKILLSKHKTNRKNSFLYHKTSIRELYSIGYEYALSKEYLDLIFRNEEGFVTEGTIHSIFLLQSDGWVTSELGQGLLPGVARKRWIRRLKAREAKIEMKDLESALKIILVNSLRGFRLVTGLDLE